MKPWAVVGMSMWLMGCQSGTRETRPVVVMDPGEGDVVWFFNESPDELGSGGELQIYIDPEQHPEAGASFAKFTLGVGGALPIHRHDKTEEIAYILEGAGAAVVLDDDGHEREIPITPGTVWYNPPGAWHAVRNKGQTPLVMVFATIPNEKLGLLSFFRKIGVTPGSPETSGTPGQDAIAIPPEEFERLGLRHDLILHSTGESEANGHHEDDQHDTKEGNEEHEHR